MELKDFVGQPCKSRLAFEFIPKALQMLDLISLAETLKKNGVMIETQVPFLLVFRLNGFGISLFRSGKIIIKDTNDAETAKQVALKLIQKMGF
ncbi:MAG: hypothetical protein V1777_00720 [Candidatus Micrarchaeota archaeon]